MKPILTCLLLVVFTTSAYSQKAIKPKTAEEVVDALCHTWTATALESGSMKLPLPLKTEILQLTVKNDGTFVRVNKEGETSGKWTYHPKVMLLLLGDNSGGKTFMVEYIPGTQELKYKYDPKPPFDYVVLKKAETVQ
jgi:hypothetical protein